MCIRDSFLPRLDRILRLEAMFLEQSGEPFAGAGRVACQNDLAATPAKPAHLVGDGLIDVGLLRSLGPKVAGRLDAEIDDPVGFRLGER